MGSLAEFLGISLSLFLLLLHLGHPTFCFGFVNGISVSIGILRE